MAEKADRRMDGWTDGKVTRETPSVHPTIRPSAGGELRVVGKAHRKVDAVAKVTGATKFADDLTLPRMLFCKLLRSPHRSSGCCGTCSSCCSTHPNSGPAGRTR